MCQRHARRWMFPVYLCCSLVLSTAPITQGQEPLRVRRNLMGMHNLKDGGVQYEIGMNWTQHLVGNGFVFDWVTDFEPWISAAMQRNLIPCIRVQDCNGGCTPGAGYPGNVAATILNWKLAHPQYADRLVYLQIWNEPSDPRDSVSPEVFADYLVAAYSNVKSAENAAAATNPDVRGTLLCMTPGQNGPSWWTQAFNHNPNAKFAFDVWGTHPYPEASPPHYNLHDGDVYIETSKTIDSYLMDLDIVASPHGNPPKSRRGFRVMITETAYGDHLGISYEGWPKTNRQMAADYNVSAFGTFWYQWPEIVAVHPFLLSNVSWTAFEWCQGGSSNPDGSPANPHPQYTAVRNLRLALESQNKLAPARVSAYRGAVGTIAGTITRSDTGAPVKYATIFTDGYEFGNVSLYDGGYVVTDVPVGTYTLSVQKVGYRTASRQITVASGQTTAADFSLVYTGKVSKGLYFVDNFAGHSGCSDCSLYSSFLGQTFRTSADVSFIKYAACKPNIDGITMKFSILDGGPTGPQIGSSITATLEPGVSGIMIGGEWPDGQEPAVQPDHTYFLKCERADGQSVYCYASDSNPYANGMCYTGTTPHSGWDLYAVIRGLTAEVNLATGSISGTVEDTSGRAIAGATVATSPGSYTATTNDSGIYTIADVPINTYSVAASAIGYSPVTQSNVIVQDGQTVAVSFALPPAPTTGAISGWVKDASNNPLSGAVVETDAGGFSAVTDAAGTYTLAGVALGTYTVRAGKSGYLVAQTSGVIVAAGQTATANFNLSQSAAFAGLLNGNFEGGYYNDPDADHRTATSWVRFTSSGLPKFSVTWLGSGAHSANYVQDFYEVNYTAGVYQRVNGAVPGGQYTGSVWVKGGNVRFRVGVDPAGGTSPTSGSIQWSDETTGTTSWQQISKQVTASASAVTIFLKATNPDGVNRNAYFDDAQLVENYRPPLQAAISRSPSTLEPTAEVSTNATDQTITISNTGGGTLVYSIGDDATWLTVSPGAGLSTGESDAITVHYATSSLTLGTYTATITIADVAAANSPQTIPVTLTITPAPVASPGDFDADGDVDLADFALLQACFNGPNRSAAQAACSASDFDGDADVDLTDFAMFQACFNGPNRPSTCSGL